MTTTLRRETPLTRLMRDAQRERSFPELLIPGEVAILFRVDPKTVLRYIYQDKFAEGGVIVTPGNHHRIYRWAVVEALLEENDKRDNLLTRQQAEEMVDVAKSYYARRRAGSTRLQKEE